MRAQAGGAVALSLDKSVHWRNRGRAATRRNREQTRAGNLPQFSSPRDRLTDRGAIPRFIKSVTVKPIVATRSALRLAGVSAGPATETGSQTGRGAAMGAGSAVQNGETRRARPPNQHLHNDQPLRYSRRSAASASGWLTILQASGSNSSVWPNRVATLASRRNSTSGPA